MSAVQWCHACKPQSAKIHSEAQRMWQHQQDRDLELGQRDSLVHVQLGLCNVALEHTLSWPQVCWGRWVPPQPSTPASCLHVFAHLLPLRVFKHFFYTQCIWTFILIVPTISSPCWLSSFSSEEETPPGQEYRCSDQMAGAVLSSGTALLVDASLSQTSHEIFWIESSVAEKKCHIWNLSLAVTLEKL